MDSSTGEESSVSPPSTTEPQIQTSTTAGGGNESGDATLLYPPPTPEETYKLQEIFNKEYEEGDVGRIEALYDIQNVFDELEKQKVMAGYDILTPYNAPQAEMTQPRTHRVEALTPRPSVGIGLFGRNHSEVKISSLPNLKPLRSGFKQLHFMKNTASLPTMSTGPFRLNEEESESLQSEKVVSKKSKSVYKGPKGPEICVSEAIEIVQKDLELVTSNEFGKPQSFPLVNKRTAEGDIDSAWKSDVNKVTRARTSSKPFTRSGEDEILQLKYKPPIWPHQQCLNQILAKVSHLTCLILDGSEIQFLRDLGSSLPSLETLSICRCGLRSVDGTFGFPNLRTFIASENKIRHPIQCSYLVFLNYLDLSDNPIEDINTFVHLRNCKKLRSLKLHSTPVSKIPDFSKKMKAMLPQVKEVFPLSVYTKFPKPNNKKLKKAEQDSRDPLQAMMRQDLNMVYEKIVDKPKPPGIGYQHVRNNQKVGKYLPPPTPTTTSTSTDDNFESVLINSIHKPKNRMLEDITTASYITEIDEDEEEESTGFTATSATPRRPGEVTTDFSCGDSRSRGFLNTGSSVPTPAGESMDEMFILRRQKTWTEFDTETD